MMLLVDMWVSMMELVFVGLDDGTCDCLGLDDGACLCGSG